MMAYLLIEYSAEINLSFTNGWERERESLIEWIKYVGTKNKLSFFGFFHTKNFLNKSWNQIIYFCSLLKSRQELDFVWEQLLLYFYIKIFVFFSKLFQYCMHLKKS